MKRHIFAIGGGRMRVPEGRQPQTAAIDESIVSAIARRRPRILFIPAASMDAPDYCTAFERHYGNTLGCHVESLLLYRARPSARLIRERILNSDVIYVGGGNTLRMMKLWRQLGIDRLLDKARKQGAILAGLSAGAICWFRWGNSDSRKFSNPDDDSLIRVRGLGFVNALCCPHYNGERHRQPALRDMMQTTPGVAIALDNCVAIEILNDRYRILRSRPRAHAWRVYWSCGQYHRERLPVTEDFQPLAPLLDKRQRLVSRRS